MKTIFTILLTLVLWINIIVLYQARVVFNKEISWNIQERVQKEKINSDDWESKYENFSSHEEFMKYLSQSWRNLNEYYPEYIPKTNYPYDNTASVDGIALAEESKMAAFQEEAFCRIPYGITIHMTRWEKTMTPCPLEDFYPLYITLENTQSQHFQVSWITYSGIKTCSVRENIPLLWPSGKFYSLYGNIVTIGEGVRDIVVDKNYTILNTPYRIWDWENWKEYRGISKNKIDVSYLPECEPNVPQK